MGKNSTKKATTAKKMVRKIQWSRYIRGPHEWWWQGGWWWRPSSGARWRKYHPDREWTWWDGNWWEGIVVVEPAPLTSLSQHAVSWLELADEPRYVK